ncbi:helix-turn-helix domain-containing protein [Candidiatus Paracoxiella cheracis]|uniref:helix-turn-helix domain-containing protein n=1 Tax=Candidiatus Paracoxiella cheracis TaxID=3405120 RepID=UPI003BF48F9E
MKQFADRLNYLLDVNGFPRKGKGRHNALAQMFQVSQIAVRKWLEGEGKPKTSRIIEMANRFNANIDWLLSGKGDPFFPTRLSEANHNNKQSSTNKTLSIRWVPIIEWASVRDGASMNPPPTEEFGYIPVPLNKCSANSYALKIKGESMIASSGAERSFLPNQIIVVDPNKRAKCGDYVIATIDHGNEAVFKQFVIEDSILYLKPLNPRYPLIKIKGSIEIIAAVVYQLDDNF